MLLVDDEATSIPMTNTTHEVNDDEDDDNQERNENRGILHKLSFLPIQ